MKDAYEGNSLFVEWNVLVDVLVEGLFSHPNGEPMVHVSDAIGPPDQYNNNNGVLMTWYFQLINPWSERFNKVVQVKRQYQHNHVKEAEILILL